MTWVSRNDFIFEDSVPHQLSKKVYWLPQPSGEPSDWWPVNLCLRKEIRNPLTKLFLFRELLLGSPQGTGFIPRYMEGRTARSVQKVYSYHVGWIVWTSGPQIRHGSEGWRPLKKLTKDNWKPSIQWWWNMALYKLGLVRMRRFGANSS